MNAEKYIKNFFGLNQIIELKKIQLDYQENVDNILSKIECKDDVVNYYIISRKYFRELQRDNFDCSIKDINNNVKKELEKSIKHYKDLYNDLNLIENSENDKCNVLKKFNNRL